MRKMQAPRKFNDFESYGEWRTNQSVENRAMRQRTVQARSAYQVARMDQLSAEPRGNNEVDLRKK